MIVERVLSFFSAFGIDLIGLVPRWPEALRLFLSDVVEGFQDVVNKVALLGPVIPFDVLAVCWVILIGAMAFALSVEVARIVLSYVTLGGGAT